MAPGNPENSEKSSQEEMNIQMDEQVEIVVEMDKIEEILEHREEENGTETVNDVNDAEETEETVDEIEISNDSLMELVRKNPILLDKNGLRVDARGFLVDLYGKTVLNSSDTALIDLLMKHAHAKHHAGVPRILYDLREFQCKRKHQDVSRFVRECSLCQLVRTPVLSRSAVGDVPWIKTLRHVGIAGVVGIDICQGLGNFHLLTITCAISKWLRATHITVQTAIEVINALRTIFEVTLFPKIIVTDKGRCLLQSKRIWDFLPIHGYC